MSLAMTMLESMAGYSQLVGQSASPSANAPVRLATIDPDYVAYSYPGTLPKVTFDGEDALTTKRYPVVGDYLPQPDQRVVMIPCGHTYVIVGPINTPSVKAYDASAVDTTQRNTGSTTYVAISSLTATIDLYAGQRAEIIIQGMENVSATGTNGAVANVRVTGASGTREPVEEEGCESGEIEWVPFYRMIPYVASVGGSHTAEMRHRVINTANAQFKNRQVIFKAL
jgi:hypothetical protein